METKLAIRKDSLQGRRINACLTFGLPLNILEIFGTSLEEISFESGEAKEGYFIFQVAFLFIDKQQRIAIFDRARTRSDQHERLTKGKGILCLATPDLKGGRSFEQQILHKVEGVQLQEIRVLGQGVSHRGEATYLLTILAATIEHDSPITIKQSKDQFTSFVNLSEAVEILGEGRDVDRSILGYLQNQEFNKEVFIPSAINCWIQNNIITGLDIYRFSTYQTDVQVLKYITLQVHIQKLLEEFKLSAYTIQTGDGCFIVFNQSSEAEALDFCLRLQERLALTNSTGDDPGDILLRYALHKGPVYKVTDLNQQANFIGDGINYCARLLGVKEANVLYTSKDFQAAVNSSGAFEKLNFEPTQLAIKHKHEPEEVFYLKLG